jgi:hypothetical protein
VKQDSLDALLVEERRFYITETTELYRRAAREVLDLVRPRRLPFATNTATVADRDYLVSLLEAGYTTVLDQSRRTMTATLHRALEPTLSQAASIGLLLDDDISGDLNRVARRQQDSVAQELDRALAYLRGFLRGGFVENFFRNDLPRVDLNEDAVFHALFRSAPDTDALLGDSVRRVTLEVFQQVASRCDYWRAAADCRGLMIENGVMMALNRFLSMASVEQQSNADQ